MPVSVGAAALKAARAEVPRELGRAFAAGALAAFAATLATGRVAPFLDQRGLAGAAGYRLLLGVAGSSVRSYSGR